MCLIAIAYKVHPEFPLIVAANRDEFLERPTDPMQFWPDAPHILAGRDLRGGGTWLGITVNGNFAALTNYRDLRKPLKRGPSRGLLVRAVLDHPVLPGDTAAYEGFNLLFGHWQHLRYHNNIDGSNISLPVGVHGLSNALLDTPWPKVLRAKRAMAKIAADHTPEASDLFDLLADGAPAATHELPDTGIGSEWESVLSSVLIKADGYGTRSSTVLIIDRKGSVKVMERTLGTGIPVDVAFNFRIQ